MNKCEETTPAVPTGQRKRPRTNAAPRRRATSTPATAGKGQTSTALACGLGAGVVQAGLLNPFDRALYLSVKEKRPFLHRENFTRPYQGFLQSVGGRAVSGGLFFPLESIFQSIYDRPDSGGHGDGGNAALTNFLVGSAAGSVNAIILNPLSAIKYRMWGKEEKERGMMQEARHMWRRGGATPFFHGFIPTILRDVVFGGTYSIPIEGFGLHRWRMGAMGIKYGRRSICNGHKWSIQPRTEHTVRHRNYGGPTDNHLGCIEFVF